MNKLKPKEKRDRLFKIDRPNIRPIELQTEQGIGKDMGILWAAYKGGSFKLMTPDLSQQDFTRFFMELSTAYTKGWIVEDHNKAFKDGYGAVGLVLAVNNEWELEPHYHQFTWASKKNVLRTCVSFFQMMRYDKGTGIVNVHARDDENLNYFKRLNSYGVLNYVGTIPHGDIKGDRHIFYVRGKKKWEMI